MRKGWPTWISAFWVVGARLKKRNESTQKIQSNRTKKKYPTQKCGNFENLDKLSHFILYLFVHRGKDKNLNNTQILDISI